MLLTLRASGKSSFYRRFFPRYDHINQDTIGTRDKCVKAARISLSEDRAVVIDATNRNKSTRAIWVALAEEFKVPIRLFHFNIPMDLARHNELYRALYAPKDEPEHAHVPPMAFAQYQQAYEPPLMKEGFEEIRTVNFVWEGTDEQKALWDRYLIAG